MKRVRFHRERASSGAPLPSVTVGVLSGYKTAHLVHVEGLHLGDQLIQGSCRQGTGLCVELYLVPEGHQRRDRHDPEGASELRLGFHVDLAEHDVGVLPRSRFEDGCKVPARAAPSGSEVHKDDLVGADHLIEVVLPQFYSCR
jgi:hypothetical protein